MDKQELQKEIEKARAHLANIEKTLKQCEYERWIMEEKKRKNGVEISKVGQRIKIFVPSYSTLIFVYQEDKKDFIKYLKYIHDKYKLNKYSYRANSVIQYGEDKIFSGESFSVKYPKFGNYLEINKIPIILDLLNYGKIK